MSVKAKPKRPVVEFVEGMPEREGRVRQQVANIASAVDRLAESEDKDDQRLIVNIYAAASEFVAGWADLEGGVPSSLRYALATIASFAREVLDVELVSQGNFSSPRWQHDFGAPSRDFTVALRDLISVLSRPAPPNEAPHLETVAELYAQGVNHQQIARMHGWVSARGEPEWWKVAEEVKCPGTHVSKVELSDDGLDRRFPNATRDALRIEQSARRVESIGNSWQEQLD